MIIISKQDYEETKERLADLASDIADLEDLAPGGKAHIDAKRLADELHRAMKLWEVFDNLPPTPFSGQAGRTL